MNTFIKKNKKITKYQKINMTIKVGKRDWFDRSVLQKLQKTNITACFKKKYILQYNNRPLVLCSISLTIDKPKHPWTLSSLLLLLIILLLFPLFLLSLIQQPPLLI